MLKSAEITSFHLKYHYSYKVLRQGVKRMQKVQKVANAEIAKKFKMLRNTKTRKVQKERFRDLTENPSSLAIFLFDASFFIGVFVYNKLI